MWCIYIHKNTKNGKVYIGQTIHQDNPQLRWDYGNGYLNKNENGKLSKFGNAIKKYGWKKFNHEILERDIPTQEEANKKEIYWISYFDSYRFGYNSTPGGNFVPEKSWDDSKRKGGSKPVYCIETKETFDSAYAAEKILGISHKRIRGCCKNKVYTAGGYHWCYCEDINNYKPKEPKVNIHNLGFKVINVKTNEIYINATEASKKTGLSKEYISSRCKGEIVSNDTWFYYDEEIRKNHPQKEKAENYFAKETKKVICIEDKKIFKNIYYASIFYEVSYTSISRSCKRKTSFRYKNRIKHIRFLEDFKNEIKEILEIIKEEDN